MSIHVVSNMSLYFLKEKFERISPLVIFLLILTMFPLDYGSILLGIN